MPNKAAAQPATIIGSLSRNDDGSSAVSRSLDDLLEAALHRQAEGQPICRCQLLLVGSPPPCSDPAPLAHRIALEADQRLSRRKFAGRLSPQLQTWQPDETTAPLVSRRPGMQSLPPNIVEIAIEPGRGIDTPRLVEVIDALIERDARATATCDVEAAQILLRATDEKLLLALVAALSEKIGGNLRVGSPQVAYRESFIVAVEADYTHKKQSGQTGQFGRVIIKIEPAARGLGIRFVNAMKMRDLPSEYVSAIEQGVLEAAAMGPIIGATLTDFTATLVGGAYHDIDSSAVAFKLAASGAIQKATAKAGVKILEPNMQIAVVTRPQWRKVVEDILIRRRAVLRETNEPGIVVATAPMAALFGVESDLAETTGGEAAVAMLFDSYVDVPPSHYHPDGTFPAAAALRE